MSEEKLARFDFVVRLPFTAPHEAVKEIGLDGFDLGRALALAKSPEWEALKAHVEDVIDTCQSHWKGDGTGRPKFAILPARTDHLHAKTHEMTQREYDLALIGFIGGIAVARQIFGLDDEDSDDHPDLTRAEETMANAAMTDPDNYDEEHVCERLMRMIDWRWSGEAWQAALADDPRRAKAEIPKKKPYDGELLG